MIQTKYSTMIIYVLIIIVSMNSVYFFISFCHFEKCNKNYTLSSEIKVDHDQDPFLLFCICPYPINDDRNRRDRYFVSFSSWLLTSPKTKILIMMSPLEFDPNNLLIPSLESIFGHGCILFTSKTIEGDEDNVPFIDEWFVNGIDYAMEAGASLVCWINADIITPKGWFPRIKFLYDHFSHKNSNKGIQFSAISRRCDFEVSDDDLSYFYEFFSTASKSSSSEKVWPNEYYYDPNENTFPSFNETFSHKWPPNYDAFATKRNRHSQWGIDFFLFSLHHIKNKKNRQNFLSMFDQIMRINVDEIPQFHMGRYRWDPWLTGWALEKAPLVTLGDSFCTYHINHKPTNRNPRSPKVKENLEMGARNNRYLASNKDATFRFGKIEKNEIEKEKNDVPENDEMIEKMFQKRIQKFEDLSRFLYKYQGSVEAKLPSNVPKANAPPNDE